ncbi:CAX-interacting protein 4-like [Nicotiana sylvestris]|uniref:CAX-interacting protein 4-like n=1 Tax=Nicotiana sylvestris TaxID=4096 RepID=UPI00388CB936
MANTSKNPSSLPQETTSTPFTTPSTTPLSKKSRVKKMACKIVTGGEQIRKINRQLKADTGAMVVWEEESAGIDESETLADLLKKVTERYNPKKKGSSKAKTPSTARENKKRKVSPSITVEIPPTRGRSTRSQKKHNEAELEKSLEESRRKAVAKGKKKMSEPVEAVDIDEMNLVLQDEDETEEVGVLTPKPRKAKTSSKKFISESKSVEQSTLEKRTRSTVKSRKVKFVEEEEDDSDAEKDKLAKFGKRIILKGKLLRDLEEEGMVLLLEKLQLQSWKDTVFRWMAGWPEMKL